VSDGFPLPQNGADDVRLLRAALRGLHDVVVLDRHPWAVRPGANRAGGGRRLRRQLLEAVAAMEPAPESPDHKGRLRHQLLVRRYVEGRGIADVGGAPDVMPPGEHTHHQFGERLIK
jgi:hypothetical protein